jgi:hypothetical protein
MNNLSFEDVRDPFFAVRGEVVQRHVALDHIHDLVTRVDVKLAPAFSPASNMGKARG